MATFSLDQMAAIENGAAVYNRSAIMRRAWVLARQDAELIARMEARGEDAGGADPFGYFLKQAWTEAKGLVSDLAFAATAATASPAKRRVIELRNVTRLGVNGLKALGTAYAALNAEAAA